MEKQVRYKTPKAEAIYPYLVKPDEYKGKKEWKCKIALDGPECDALKEIVDALVDAGFVLKTADLKGAAKKNVTKFYPYTEEYDKETDEPTGRLLFNFKRIAEYTDKKTGEVKTLDIWRYDKFGKRISDVSVLGNPGSGTTLRIEFEDYPFYNAATNSAGASLRITSVQFIDVVEFAGNGGWDSEGDNDQAPSDADDF